ncbi:MAG: YbjN domain-containing protein [Solirubrobacteraceae bacterium]|nr:YbjN domain-containing protein [Solirubrobacteraceae bacterium]
MDAAGWPLDIGLAVRAGVLRAQAQALGPGAVAAHELLHRNRRLRLVRFTHAADGAVWVEADLPAEAVTEPLVDRLLGSVVAAATTIRERAADLAR